MIRTFSNDELIEQINYYYHNRVDFEPRKFIHSISFVELYNKLAKYNILVDDSKLIWDDVIIEYESDRLILKYDY